MSGVKILIVDDRESNLLSIEAIFASDGYTFVRATSGRQALQVLLKEQDFNLILMDVEMPGLSGFETASLIYEREKLKDIPIIFITAHSYSDETIYEGYKAGALDYIYKPIKSQLLKAKVSVFIDLHKKTQELIVREAELKAINASLEVEIQERKHSEEQIQNLNQQLIDNIHILENANAELARFAYVASHDLQEPLRKLYTYGDLVKTKYASAMGDEGKFYIERMQKSSLRMRHLIEDILTYSRLTDGNQFFTKSNLNEIINDILIDLEPRIKESDAKIQIETLPELYVNPGQMTQLFQNIISNALKFGRKNVSSIIDITYEINNKGVNQSANGQQYCHIYIRDNGIGFDEAYIDQIFTLFRRLQSGYEGTGIGLAICKKIVEQHKGFIRATSKPHEGPTFIVSLPVEHLEQEQ